MSENFVLQFANPIFVEDQNETAINIWNASVKEIERLNNIIDETFDNRFIMSSNERGIERFEHIFDVQPDKITQDLDFRKQALRIKKLLKPPFTDQYWIELFDSILGAGNYLKRVDYANQILYFEFMAENILWYKQIIYTIGVIKPTMLIFRPVPKMFTRTNTRVEWSAEQRSYFNVGYNSVGFTSLIRSIDLGVTSMTTNLPIRNSFKARKFGEDVTNVRIFSNEILSDTLLVTTSSIDNIASLSFDIPASIMMQGNLTMQFIGTEEEYEIEGIGLPSLNQSVTINYSDITGVN